MTKFREWVESYWVTYVSMSRAERRRLVAIINEASFPEDFVEVERPGA
jgi:hypothetical protein